jgi:tetratricopeptide (TPR) repeat protein
VRTRTEEDRRRRDAAEQTRRAAEEVRDQGGHNRLVELAQKQLAEEKFAAAVTTLQSARRLRRSDEVDRLLGQALVGQARAAAQKKGEGAALEKQLAEEKAKREAAEAEARGKRESYTAALLGAQQALAEKRFDQALLKFQQAKLVYATDIVLAGLRQAEDGLARERAAREADQRRQAEEAKKTAEFQRLQQEARSALADRQYDRAIQSYRAADRLVPGDVDVLAGLSRAEQLHEQQAVAQRRRQAEQAKETAFRTLLESGKSNLAARRYEAAVAALAEAVKLKPDDAAAKAALGQAEQARGASAGDARTRAEQKNAAEYQQRLGAGRAALAARQYDVALESFREAQRLLPGDQTAAAFIKEAEQGKQGAAAQAAQDGQKAREAEAARRRAEEARLKAQQEQEQARRQAAAAAAEQKKHQAEYQRALDLGRASLQAKRPDEAIKHFTEALRLQPGDADAAAQLRQAEKAQQDARAARQAEALRQQGARMPPPAPRPGPPALPAAAQAEFNMHLADGKRFAAARRFADAIKEYEAALKLSPGNPEATAALERARAGKP